MLAATPVASLGPALLTRPLKVTFCVASTGSGESISVIDRSADPTSTVSLSVALLSAVFNSVSEAVAVIVLLSVPVALAGMEQKAT